MQREALAEHAQARARHLDVGLAEARARRDDDRLEQARRLGGADQRLGHAGAAASSPRVNELPAAALLDQRGEQRRVARGRSHHAADVGEREALSAWSSRMRRSATRWLSPYRRPVRARARRREQALRLVEADRVDGDAGGRRQLLDSVFHAMSLRVFARICPNDPRDDRERDAAAEERAQVELRLLRRVAALG